MPQRYHSGDLTSTDVASMNSPTDPRPGLIAVPLAKACRLLIREATYVAGLRLGRLLRRREAAATGPQTR